MGRVCSWQGPDTPAHAGHIQKNRACLNKLDRATTMKAKASVVDKYAREQRDMTADVDIVENDTNSHPQHPVSPFSARFCGVPHKKRCETSMPRLHV